MRFAALLLLGLLGCTQADYAEVEDSLPRRYLGELPGPGASSDVQLYMVASPASECFVVAVKYDAVSIAPARCVVP